MLYDTLCFDVIQGAMKINNSLSLIPVNIREILGIAIAFALTGFGFLFFVIGSELFTTTFSYNKNSGWTLEQTDQDQLHQAVVSAVPTLLVAWKMWAKLQVDSSQISGSDEN